MNSFIESLASTISENPKFGQDFDDLLRFGFSKLQSKRNVTIDENMVRRLAEAAMILATSPQDIHKQMAFEVASTLYEQFSSDLPGLGGFTKLICSRLGNFPAVNLLNPESVALPTTLEVETQTVLSEHTRKVGTEVLKLTGFQYLSFDLLSKHVSLSLSAPTSAGKSFLITQFVVDQLATSEKYWAVVLVPTRALIRQMVADFTKVFGQFGTEVFAPERFSIVTSSVEPETPIPPKALFVLTQERLQAVLHNWKVSPEFDLLVVDESQKVGDKKRGIILEDSIAEVIAKQQKVQTVYLSPLASNPDFLFEIGDSHLHEESVHTVLSPVAQHVYSVKTNSSKKGKLSISRIVQGSEQFILEIEMNTQIPTKKSERLSFIAKFLSKGKSSIVYSNGPAEAEQNALSLAKGRKAIQSPEITETIQSLEEFIHEEYYLVDCLRKGVGYHFGAMPDIAKVSVEDLFRNESIAYIACTSTLLEGVNLPAKNIFIDRPKLGQEPMDDSSFWNLAGRAGRLMKDLSGNVFCVNQKDWDKPVIERKRKYVIESSFNRVLNSELFFDYLREPTVKTNSEGFEYAVNNLVLRVKEQGVDLTQSFLEKRMMAEKAKRLVSQVAIIAKDISLPSELLKKNKGIEGRLQQNFVRYLIGLNRDALIGLLPRQPMVISNLFEYLDYVFAVTDRYFVLEDRGQRHRYFAQVANQWVREESIESMINSSIQYQRRRMNKDDINKTIRDLIQSLNDGVRFHYVQNVKCYCDLLQYVLDSLNISVTNFHYVDFGLPNYLELGMYNPGTIQLHNSGLSRTSSIVVNRYVRGRGISGDAITTWVKENLQEIAVSVPRPCRIELLRIFSQ